MGLVHGIAPQSPHGKDKAVLQPPGISKGGVRLFFFLLSTPQHLRGGYD